MFFGGSFLGVAGESLRDLWQGLSCPCLHKDTGIDDQEIKVVPSDKATQKEVDACVTRIQRRNKLVSVYACDLGGAVHQVQLVLVGTTCGLLLGYCRTTFRVLSQYVISLTAFFDLLV